ncbi:MAG: hypothetical protein Q7P63_08840 [Verrucomicrobiota bacterium JB022]|nr:hypothetical protein [Verrucomicrobiota bacterium JB022]
MRWLYRLLIVSVLGYAGLVGYCRQENIAYVERIAGVDLPNRRLAMEFFDNGDNVLVGYIKTTPKAAAKFVQAHEFEGQGGVSLKALPLVEKLSEEHRREPEGFNPYYLRDFSELNTWLFLIDVPTGQIWFTIFYPDWAGDPAGGGLLYLPKDVTLPESLNKMQ